MEDTVIGVRMHIYDSTRAYIAIAGLGTRACRARVIEIQVLVGTWKRLRKQIWLF
jgi:hypothetical protein